MVARARRAPVPADVPELGISTEKVCDLIEILREYAGRELPNAPQDVSEGDDGPMELMEDRPDDPSLGEAREFIAGLSLDERVTLQAVLWVGRGDYGIDEWPSALAEARRRDSTGDLDFALGEELTPQEFAEGLDAFGRSCTDEPSESERGAKSI
jgi:hypothetical protein